MSSTGGPDLRCSALTRDLGERPAGTAGSWHRVILVELPLPWPASIEDHPLLVGHVAPPTAGRSHRILALASALSPGEAAPDEGLRVVCYWRPVEAPFGRFARAEICAPETDVAEIVSLLITADDAHLAAIPADAFAAGPARVEQPVRDLLVCTHGSRDRCCGTFGTRLFGALDGRVPEGVRLWRTSHTGGHRFAPTGLTFPDGGTWAGLDGDLARGLIGRTVTARRAAAHARGSAGIPTGPAQVADITGLERRGWAWLDHDRTVTLTDDARSNDTIVTIATGETTHRAVVRPGRTITVPDCGHPLSDAAKTTVEWTLVSFDEEGPTGV